MSVCRRKHPHQKKTQKFKSDLHKRNTKIPTRLKHVILKSGSETGKKHSDWGANPKSNIQLLHLLRQLRAVPITRSCIPSQAASYFRLSNNQVINTLTPSHRRSLLGIDRATHCSWCPFFHPHTHECSLDKSNEPLQNAWIWPSVTGWCRFRLVFWRYTSYLFCFFLQIGLLMICKQACKSKYTWQSSAYCCSNCQIYFDTKFFLWTLWSFGMHCLQTHLQIRTVFERFSTISVSNYI